MTTLELLSLMRLLSAMESAMLASKVTFPCYLSDDVTRHTEILEREILERTKPTDAERYRHLRDCNSGSLVVVQITGTGEDDWYVLTEDDADAAIDTARKQGANHD